MNRSLTLSVLSDRAEAVFGLPEGSVRGRSRKGGIVRARAAVVWLARKRMEYSFPMIGRMLSGRDHSTVINSFRTAEELYETDATFRSAVMAITGDTIICPCCKRDLLNVA